MNYNDGKWHGWNGGKCPVHPASKVKVRYPEGPYHSDMASLVLWDFCLVFRVIKEHKTPREFWLVDDCGGGFIVNHSDSCGGIHVREVLDDES